MNAGSIATSERLQHTLAILRDGQPHSTWDLASQTRSCAVHSDIAALRQGGFTVSCSLVRVDPDTRRRVYEYRMKEGDAPCSQSSV